MIRLLSFIAAVVLFIPGGKAQLIDVSTPQGTNPIYRVGDRVEFFVSVRAPAKVYCFYVENQKDIYQVFPNQLQPNPVLQNAAVIRFPPQGQPSPIILDQVGISELVYCLAIDVKQRFDIFEIVNKKVMIPSYRAFKEKIRLAYQSGESSEINWVVTQ